MSNVSMVEAALPPGFRFHPNDDELICDYLMKKLTHCDSLLMVEVDLNKCEPWDIPETACVGGKDWYFYSQRDRKYATGLRTNRATASGYWKATGKDRAVLRKGSLVGMRKTLVFYQGRAPRGRKSDWVMHEFRLEGPLAPKISPHKEDWVLCRVFYKNREVVAKPGVGSCYNVTSTSSLPALMDSYITFDQTHPDMDDEYEKEQVSCFSIFSPNQTIPTLSQFTQMEPNISSMSKSDFGKINLNPPLDPFSSDKQVIKAALNNLTKMESNLNVKEASSLGEGSSESYLSEVGMPNVWSHF